MTKRQRTIARILFVLYLIAVAWVCFSKFGSISGVHRSYWGIPTDKIVHFLMFLPYPVLAYLAFIPRTRTFWSTLLWTAVILLTGCAVAGATEIVQARYLPYRMGDFADFEADLLALGLTSAAVFVIDLLKHRKS